eukprot:4702606-Pyramimonas_sp.AAC.1
MRSLLACKTLNNGLQQVGVVRMSQAKWPPWKTFLDVGGDRVKATSSARTRNIIAMNCYRISALSASSPHLPTGFRCVRLTLFPARVQKRRAAIRLQTPNFTARAPLRQVEFNLRA